MDLKSGRKILLGIVYAIVVAVASTLASKWITQDSSHESSIMSMVSYPKGSLKDVGGHRALKRELRTFVLLPLKHPHIFYGGATHRPPRGVLLHGPPGTGKTMLVQAIASEAKVPLLSLHAAALESKWWGESPKLLASAFATAKRIAPCLLFFDEIDSMGRARSEMDQSCVYSFKCELLRNMDGVDGSAPVIVVACTNNVKSIDAALKRRFDRIVEVAPPDAVARRDIWRKLVGVDDAALVDALVKQTDGRTGADLASMHSLAHARRLQTGNVARAIADGRITTHDDLLANLGPLRLEHFVA